MLNIGFMERYLENKTKETIKKKFNKPRLHFNKELYKRPK